VLPHDEIAEIGVFGQDHPISLARELEDVLVLLSKGHIADQDEYMPITLQTLNDAARDILVHQEIHEAACAPMASAA
jgi:hypothetical protein